MSRSPQDSNGLTHDRDAQRQPVKLLVGYEVGERDEHWEVGTFRVVNEAIVAAKDIVDSFLLRHHKPHLRGRQLYDHFVKFGPDLVVEASMEAPVFQGWRYARERVRFFCGVW
ncbi:MAG: hypothetical protein M3032_04515 [Verrucomicrobiota bacterium]|nr:hypothetical protein [Verrucomicrobiota bacterium]